MLATKVTNSASSFFKMLICLLYIKGEAYTALRERATGHMLRAVFLT